MTKWAQTILFTVLSAAVLYLMVGLILWLLLDNLNGSFFLLMGVYILVGAGLWYLYVRTHPDKIKEHERSERDERSTLIRGRAATVSHIMMIVVLIVAQSVSFTLGRADLGLILSAVLFIQNIGYFIAFLYYKTKF
ncbi:MAG TPA: hypothetical protein DEB24_04390 [Coriobacteriia bacterium]|nr:hypothetical protein [Coriobacteriia bacterium]